MVAPDRKAAMASRVPVGYQWDLFRGKTREDQIVAERTKPHLWLRVAVRLYGLLVMMSHALMVSLNERPSGLQL